jgi:hypothetical protein
MLDASCLKGAAFCIEYRFFEYAEEMLGQLSAEASASSVAAALQQRISEY